MDAENTLYERIGGEDGIDRLVKSFYQKVLDDGELRPYFESVPMSKLRHMQREFFAMATGGPIKYSGRPLSHVHQPLDISKREFGRFVERLIETLRETTDLSEEDILDLIAKINIYVGDITNDVSTDG